LRVQAVLAFPVNPQLVFNRLRDEAQDITADEKAADTGDDKTVDGAQQAGAQILDVLAEGHARLGEEVLGAFATFALKLHGECVTLSGEREPQGRPNYGASRCVILSTALALLKLPRLRFRQHSQGNPRWPNASTARIGGNLPMAKFLGHQDLI